MKEFMKIQVGDEISFQTKNSQKKGILLNKKYPIKDIFNVNEYETDTYNEGDWKCIAFIGENKRRVVFRNNIKNINSYKFSIHKRDEKKEFKWTDEKVKDFCRIYTIGGYSDDYKNCKTIEKKMYKFKELNMDKKSISRIRIPVLKKLIKKYQSELDRHLMVVKKDKKNGV